LVEFEAREWIAYGILAALVAGATGAALFYRQKARWRKLRMAGNGAAKRRELRRRR
jgi:hypothetical protein